MNPDTQKYDVITSGTISLDYKLVKVSPVRTIAYDFNGGQGTPVSPETVEQIDPYVVKDVNVSKSGYRFAGWSDGTNVYQPGDTITVGWENITLKAVWEKNDTQPLSISLLIILIVAVLGVIVVGASRRRY